MRTRVMARGLRSAQEAAQAVLTGADAIVVSMDDVADPEERRRIAGAAPPGVSAILETELTAAPDIVEAARQAQVSAILLRRPLPSAEPARLEALAPTIQRILSAPATRPGAVAAIDTARAAAHAFLLEAGPAPDWGLCADLARLAARPVFLAGGLTPATVSRAIQIVRPFGLVLSLADQGGDPERLRAFFHAVRAADWAFAAREAAP